MTDIMTDIMDIWKSLWKKCKRAFYSCRWLNSNYVIADPKDNSITFSRSLYKHMEVDITDKAKVSVFKENVAQCYAFSVNTGIKETQLADIQYNSKYKCIGFECLVPTVNRIFFDYGLPHDRRIKLSVRIRHSKIGMTYYVIIPPTNQQITRLCKIY